MYERQYMKVLVCKRWVRHDCGGAKQNPSKGSGIIVNALVGCFQRAPKAARFAPLLPRSSVADPR